MISPWNKLNANAVAVSLPNLKYGQSRMKEVNSRNLAKWELLWCYWYFSLFALQGFFKDLLTVNNPHVSPQRVEEYVNGAVSYLTNKFHLAVRVCSDNSPWWRQTAIRAKRRRETWLRFSRRFDVHRAVSKYTSTEKCNVLVIFMISFLWLMTLFVRFYLNR